MIDLRVASACAAIAASSFACAPPKEGKVAREVRIARAENAPDKLVEKGKAFQEVGDLTRAEQYYAAALQSGASEKEVLPLLLRVCVQANRYQVAVEYAEPFLKRHPGDWRLRMVVASLQLAIGHPAVAREHYERVLEQNPDEPTAHYALAVLLRDELHDRVGADTHFRAYLRVLPDGPHAEEARESLLKPVVPTSEPVAEPETAMPPGSGSGSGSEKDSLPEGAPTKIPMPVPKP